MSKTRLFQQPGREQLQSIFKRVRRDPVIRIGKRHPSNQELRPKATVNRSSIGSRFQDFEGIQEFLCLLVSFVRDSRVRLPKKEFTYDVRTNDRRIKA
jgi:hypothetical protein